MNKTIAFLFARIVQWCRLLPPDFLKDRVDMINAENPDLILTAGDVVDRSIRPVVEGN